VTAAGYNGWANYPTWAVATWLGSEASSHAALEHTVRSWDSRTARAGGTLSELANALRELVENLSAVEAARADATLASDLLGSALASVDWLELAQVHALGVVPGDSTLDRADEINRRRDAYLQALIERSA
jgi:hypothetical protein